MFSMMPHFGPSHQDQHQKLYQYACQPKSNSIICTSWSSSTLPNPFSTSFETPMSSDYVYYHCPTSTASSASLQSHFPSHSLSSHPPSLSTSPIPPKMNPISLVSPTFTHVSSPSPEPSLLLNQSLSYSTPSSAYSSPSKTDLSETSDIVRKRVFDSDDDNVGNDFNPSSPVSKRCKLTSQHSCFFRSEKTYTISSQFLGHKTEKDIQHMLDTEYGGRLIISKRRRSSEMPHKTMLSSIITSTTKQPQGRPYSTEMIIDAIFPESLDELYSFLCVKGSTPQAHRVKLSSVHPMPLSGADKCYPPQENGIPVFSSSLEMIKYFTGGSCFSLVTAYRQSSVDRSPHKKGTCPVVKFEVEPVTDFSVDFLKRMAYPRYKAGMKVYLIPKHPSNLGGIGNEINTGKLVFYTHPGMFLQDQVQRLSQGLTMDTCSRIFHVDGIADIPGHVVYDKNIYECRSVPKTRLNYILN
ncbi:Hypothetical protein, no similarity [Geotrichum candidum]|uniref:Uncharacterized protein n=1 Tax=Geotrichum candidum TaxID=1173061 RepID=A0A0J9XKW4_GEOCN|nr:Hypothetical protein, no similarity [Geotrichum candidum]